MLVKPCRVIHLILDKIFILLIFETDLNSQLKSMKARREKPSFYLFPKTFTFGAPLQQNEEPYVRFVS